MNRVCIACIARLASRPLYRCDWLTSSCSFGCSQQKKVFSAAQQYSPRLCSPQPIIIIAALRWVTILRRVDPAAFRSVSANISPGTYSHGRCTVTSRQALPLLRHQHATLIADIQFISVSRQHQCGRHCDGRGAHQHALCSYTTSATGSDPYGGGM
jgi:hypothetical protein